MSDSLRDQLLKKGLATKKQAKAAAAESRKTAKAARKKGGEDETSGAHEYSDKQKERAARDRELNRERDEVRRAKELEAQIRDLITRNRVRCDKGDITYHFTHGTHVKKIAVDEDARRQLGDGRLAIAVFDDEYHLVPADAAEKILERLPGVVVCFNEPNDKPDENDPYAEFEVPDDLTW